MTTAGVIVVGAGPVGCTAALLLADRGIPVTVLERHEQAHPLPRAVHLDDEVLRILHQVGVSEDFLLASRPATGLRLVDGSRRVMAEFRRDPGTSHNGFPAANMFHQPELEALLLDRVAEHPLISMHRGLDVQALVAGPEVRVHARRAGDDSLQVLAAAFVLGCDGANSTVRDLLAIPMDDLDFTERWLVVDVRSGLALDGWGGVEQVCDPARPATFMRVVDDLYRWEFKLGDGEDEATLVSPRALGGLLQPWTGRVDLEGVDVVRSASYTFRARLARRFAAGSVFLLGDAAHLTPPFIGQGLGAGLRDADNLAWKLADVLDGRACPDLLSTYETERRPHARTLIQRAVRVGWAMTGGQDRAAVVRRAGLALAVRSARVRNAIAKPSTPPLKRGALQTQRPLHALRGPRVGALLPNPEVVGSDGRRCRLDDVLAGRTAVLTSRVPDEQLVRSCRALGISLVRVRRSSEPLSTLDDYVDLGLEDHGSGLQGLLDDPSVAVVVRPDRVVAAVHRGAAPQDLPWQVSPAAHALSGSAR